jgi:trigger factor
MKLHITRQPETLARLEIAASAEELTKVKNKVLKKLAPQVKVPGFRAGKIPLSLVEKSLDQALLQSEFIDAAVNMMYFEAIKSEKIRPVAQPKVSIKKFVPYTTLEFDMEVSCVGRIKTADFKKIVVKKPALVKVTDKDIRQVLENLATRLAERKDVNTAAKETDQVWIDFSGVDHKGEAVKGADGKDYPLVLGSKMFIPGFEENLIGLRGGDQKTFDLTFPKDYGMKALQNKKVTFTVKVNKVQEVIKPACDDAFASKVGPFKSIDELKADIKKQLEAEKQAEQKKNYEIAVVNAIVEKSSVTIPDVMIEEQVEFMIAETKRTIVHRGLTYQDFLENEGKSEDEYKEQVLKPDALRRLTTGLVLGDIADSAGIDVTDQELTDYVTRLKAQYGDEEMQKQLNNPENLRELSARLRSDKTVRYLVSLQK